MRVLVACEFSQIVCAAFRARGHEAFSCDVLPTEGEPDWHIQCDVREVLHLRWDLMIAHPPCTYLAVSGARHMRYRMSQTQEAIDFVCELMEADIPRKAIENPVSIISTVIRKPDQIIQPWMFGHPERKATCLWLNDLPPLTPTLEVVPDEKSRIHYESPGADRWKRRSRTYTGIASAMANQWGA